MSRILVWQWGRRGAGPRFAVDLAAAVGALPGAEALLSLSFQAEILRARLPPFCDLPVSTYRGPVGLAWRLLMLRLHAASLARRLEGLRLDGAICAMPAPLDLMMAVALRRIGIPFLVLVHDAEAHPGDGLPLQMYLQGRLLRRADVLAALSTHVADSLAAAGARGIVVAPHPPLAFGPPPPPPLGHGGALRLLNFGRLRSYKGLDLLDDALTLLGPRSDLCLRVVGQGPETDVLDRLRRRSGVIVENRWVAEHDIAALLAWADALVLPYREATQSGVAASAVAAGRFVLATRVGGLEAQLQSAPGARLCEPTAPGLAAGLAALLDNPGPPPPPADLRPAWRDLAQTMVEALPKNKLRA